MTVSLTGKRYTKHKQLPFRINFVSTFHFQDSFALFGRFGQDLLREEGRGILWVGGLIYCLIGSPAVFKVFRGSLTFSKHYTKDHDTHGVNSLNAENCVNSLSSVLKSSDSDSVCNKQNLLHVMMKINLSFFLTHVSLAKEMERDEFSPAL